MAPGRGDYYLHPSGEPAQTPGRWLAPIPRRWRRLGIGARRRRRQGFRGADGGASSTRRRLVACGGRGRCARGRDRSDVQRAEVRLRCVGARLTERRAQAVEDAHAEAVRRTLAHLRQQVPAVRRRAGGGDRGAGTGSGRGRVPAHDSARGDRRRSARPAAALPRRHHVRGPRGRQLVAVASRPLFRAARELGALLPLARSPRSCRPRASGSRPGPAATVGFFEIDGVPQGCSTRSRRAAGRSPPPRSGSGPAGTPARPRASCGG